MMIALVMDPFAYNAVALTRAPTHAHACTRMHAPTRAPMQPMYRMTKTAQAAAPMSRAPAHDVRPAAGRRIQVRRSGVHGKGVFALREIAAGERVIEYTGERIGWREALRRHPHDPADPHHTFYFSLETGGVIDAKVGGNASRWINHACDPNCEAEETDGRVFIKALRDLMPGEELFYDYGLVIDERLTPTLKRQYACRCGAAGCRGTMLAPKRRRATR
jgi:SET domain-containing protein